MKDRRQFSTCLLAGLMSPLAAPLARAQSYPSRPVRILVGYTAGGVSDILARLIGQWLSGRLGQPFVVENRPGAASNIATDAVAHAPADGYTLLLAGISNAINVAVYENVNFDFIRDLAPVAMISRSPLVMEVNRAVPATTVPEFIAYAKANPGAINMSSAGTGGATHVAGELFAMMAGIKMSHVPYHGAPPALADLLAGRVQIMFDNMASSVELIKAGRLRALAVTTTARSEALPDLPPIAEFLPDYEADVWNGIVAPRNTPPDVVAKLNREINAALADAKFTADLAKLGNVPAPGSPADFQKVIADDTEKWTKVVRFIGLKPS
ncbi:MAG TPA: tripartite tricarboxylate transporter substrate binding protein [Xanthobacteraceae bacterium]|nr:tripartite tricarboxylate transporter substrate binding protein [Xanthobacteraceae bacterium]